MPIIIDTTWQLIGLATGGLALVLIVTVALPVFIDGFNRLIGW